MEGGIDRLHNLNSLRQLAFKCRYWKNKFHYPGYHSIRIQIYLPASFLENIFNNLETIFQAYHQEVTTPIGLVRPLHYQRE